MKKNKFEIGEIVYDTMDYGRIEPGIVLEVYVGEKNSSKFYYDVYFFLDNEIEWCEEQELESN